MPHRCCSGRRTSSLRNANGSTRVVKAVLSASLEQDRDLDPFRTSVILERAHSGSSASRCVTYSGTTAPGR